MLHQLDLLDFEVGTEGLLLIGEGGRILDANPQACRLLQRAREEVLEAGSVETFDFSEPKFVEAREQARNSGSFKGTVSMVRKGATSFTAEFSVLRRLEGEEECFAVVFREVGEYHTIQQSLRRGLDLLLAVHEGGEDPGFHPRCTGGGG